MPSFDPEEVAVVPLGRRYWYFEGGATAPSSGRSRGKLWWC
ncbi:hypothetical protein HMPREF1556_01162 [Porphyromonas sp. oral taxon 278 str. W7784]|nr:hypothetical protein HMPREF1556_01162 [Porphyromonas sp. oral taxon 278 str. W7784]